MIDSFAQDGFRLSDDTKILGPCVIFPTAVLGNAICTVTVQCTVYTYNLFELCGFGQILI